MDNWEVVKALCMAELYVSGKYTHCMKKLQDPILDISLFFLQNEKKGSRIESLGNTFAWILGEDFLLQVEEQG